MTERIALPLFVVYENPRDYPGKFVVRVQWPLVTGEAEPERDPLAVVDSLSEARAVLPPGVFRLGRDIADDPVIAEVWL